MENKSKVDIVSWEEAKKEFGKIALSWDRKDGSSRPLFRGQPNSEWELRTTLDRTCRNSVGVERYHKILRTLNNEAASYRKLNQEIENYSEYEFWEEEWLDRFPKNTFELMIYLRHHGFPFPLLDWSRSPYVAAFFAFKNAGLKVDNVSIFVYQEMPAGSKGYDGGAPYISALPSNVAAHPRHFVQQCEYTVCIQKQAEGFFYMPHQLVFDRQEKGQDLLRQFNIPISERNKGYL
jgi:hypothetical protein